MFVKSLGKCVKLAFIAQSAAVIHNNAFNWFPGETMPQGLVKQGINYFYVLNSFHFIFIKGALSSIIILKD